MGCNSLGTSVVVYLEGKYDAYQQVVILYSVKLNISTLCPYYAYCCFMVCKENMDEYEKYCYILVKVNYSLFCSSENYQILMIITKYLDGSLDAVLLM